MPVRMEIDLDQDLTTAVASSPLTLEEIEQAIVDFYADRTTSKVIIDLNDASLTHFQIDEIKKILQIVNRQFYNRPGAKTAFVTAKDSDYGMIRMGEAYASEMPVQLKGFRSREAAEQWLNQD